MLLDVSLPDRNGLEMLPRDPPARSESFRHSDHRLRIHRYGARRIQRRRAGLHHQALVQRRTVAQVSLAIEGRRLREENVQLKRALKQRYNFPNIIGKSQKMLAVFDLVTQVAPSRSTVLISGESGTGKEVIAKAIHSASTRADKAFIPINTGSIPVDLLESQLFGHVKGAFTSAVASKKGLFEVADQGTIFFDEISTVSPETQAKLLRVIQEREFMRLGGTDTIKVDVRILAASNEDLRKLVRDGRFREDLFHRLNVISSHFPPLRERKEDIPLLIARFLDAVLPGKHQATAPFTHGAMKLLIDYDWPGNIRELENAIERAVVLSIRNRWTAICCRKPSVLAKSSRACACSWPNFCPPCRANRRAKFRSSALALRDSGRSRAPHHRGHAGAHQLEPDRSGRAFPGSVVYAEPENQTSRHRNPSPPVSSARSRLPGRFRRIRRREIICFAAPKPIV